jgi:hypothetical protein
VRTPGGESRSRRHQLGHPVELESRMCRGDTGDITGPTVCLAPFGTIVVLSPPHMSERDLIRRDYPSVGCGYHPKPL